MGWIKYIGIRWAVSSGGLECFFMDVKGMHSLVCCSELFAFEYKAFR